MNIKKYIIDIFNSNEEIIQKAAEIVNQGGLFVAPTETCYMLSGDALNQKVIAKIFDLKQRANIPLPVIVADIAMAKSLCFWPKAAQLLAEKHWPGPLTMVLRKRKIVPETLVASGETIALRVSGCTLTVKISALAKKPLIATSANLSGGSNPYSVDEILGQFGVRNTEIDLFLDGGHLPQKPPTTLVDLTKRVPVVLRKGEISI